ncbi:activating signal cointegrator 1 complex subunit 2 homolog isoform X3 [Myripristis murdjan]|uniref:activating signal cointegrator 1 complex subunit 2 homolog isoform X3 n=1 Tax=Myripristis murdjan TaxID=586833 RepID=UPI00117644AD|nr:activating signal cointegrator 1 complex subunit 2 homolog isoform X3 [Myripristis murdjan]XP_029927386.1 activating signal cointegrator 1 complex subunit 2 homolog isoform X3 [Myripristis murdjan]XP_029927387.1 activating signal cointegrator 1 complex subunit 2 homolog isoform X3 [Myripristis murdjan]XP_029927388.1 activating signal cointegrator 1 complex subunit 2 homolog isoform X3 [Myripristis murdjan]
MVEAMGLLLRVVVLSLVVLGENQANAYSTGSKAYTEKTGDARDHIPHYQADQSGSHYGSQPHGSVGAAWSFYNSYSANQPSKQPSKQPSYQQPSYQQPSYQQPSKQPSYQPSYQQPSYQQPSKQPSYQPSYQQPSKQPSYQPSYHQPRYREPRYREPRYRQPRYNYGSHPTSSHSHGAVSHMYSHGLGMDNEAAHGHDRGWGGHGHH